MKEGGNVFEIKQIGVEVMGDLEGEKEGRNYVFIFFKIKRDKKYIQLSIV